MIKIVPLLCGRITLERGQFTGKENDGHWDLPVIAYFVKHPKANMLFDTGLPPVLSETGQPMNLAPGVTAFPADSGGIVRELIREGYCPNDIEIVVNSHLHLDHAGGNSLFANAFFYIQRTEFETTVTDGCYDELIFGAAARVYHVGGDVDFFGDGTCCLLTTPGHSPGHQSMLVSSDYGKALLVGDACFRPDNLNSHTIPLLVHDREQALRSVARLRDAAIGNQAAILTAHDPELKLSHR